jgi:hypothetical protein
MILDRIDTKLNMSDHFTKNLSRTLFHRHADFLLGHIPPSYSPVYSFLIGTYTDHDIDISSYVPTTFTTPMTVAAARVSAPLITIMLGIHGPSSSGMDNPSLTLRIVGG